VNAKLQWLYKIVLRSPPRQSNHVQWLGLTMRVSKTFVSFRAEQTPAINGVAVTLATDDELREFFVDLMRPVTEAA
jgi:hypothetical protein